MPRVAKLIMVTSVNNNKYYDMVEEGGSIKVKYGRVGQSVQTATYPMSKWDSLIKSKIKKGYKDVTNYRLETTSIDFASISDDEISDIVLELQNLANRSIHSNYTVSSDSVTLAQVSEAQKIIDSLLEISNQTRVTLQSFNQQLIELFQIIPRRMSEVANYLASSTDRDELNKIISKEQATLDVMKGQVKVAALKRENKADNKKNILDAMGIEIILCSKEDIALIKKELGEISNKFRRAFKVINKRTQATFDNFISTRPNKTTRLFWHGSRNENWWSIIDTGLVLRPTNAVITGKMFGYGLYFADKARKSYGYTSCTGSYWARGTAAKGFMSLYEVHLGNSLVSKVREGWMGSATEKTLKQKGDYDSLTALGGADLRNNEFIIYNEKQCTIKYLVEVD